MPRYNWEPPLAISAIIALQSTAWEQEEMFRQKAKCKGWACRQILVDSYNNDLQLKTLLKGLALELQVAGEGDEGRCLMNQPKEGD